MPDFCTCGAQLPPDALFCHKCGKPQREIAALEPEPPPAPVFVPAPELQPRQFPLPSFRNPIAVRIGLLLAVVATVLSFIPFLNWLAAGFFAAFFYRRRTGPLSVEGGMRMGWITGLLTFVLAAVGALPAVLSNQLASMYEQQMKTLPFQDPAAVQQISRFLASGPGIALLMVTLFIFSTCLSMAGGALGAKLLGGTRSAPR